MAKENRNSEWNGGKIKYESHAQEEMLNIVQDSMNTLIGSSKTVIMVGDFESEEVR